MEFRLLEYFLAVCEELHFTRAAEKLGISQPTLSQQIRLLEHRIGSPLFQRIGKRIYVTEAGDILRKHVQNVFHELEQAQAAIAELAGMQRGRLRIGCSGNHLLSGPISAFHALYPGIELSVTELATEETKERLLDNQLDLGVVFLPLYGDDTPLESFPLLEEQLVLVVSRQHKLAKAASIRLEELRTLPLAMLQQKFHVRQMIDRSSQEAGFELRPQLELSTLDSLLQIAALHIGAAVLPASYLRQHADDSRIHVLPIVDPTPQQSVGIVYRKDAFHGAAVTTFIRQLKESFPAAGTTNKPQR